MIIYIIVFALSVLAMRRACLLEEQAKSIKKLYLIISAGVLIILAALRGDGVGADVIGYQKRLFLLSFRAKSLQHFLSISTEEPLYSVITYIGAKFGHMSIVHMFNMMVIVIPIVYVIWRNRNEIEPSTSLALYCVLCYGKGYNMARQEMAISLSILSLYFFAQRKIPRMLLFFVLAVGCHMTALVTLILPFFYWVSKSGLRKYYQVLLAMAGILFAVFSKSILGFFGRLLSVYRMSYAHRLAISADDVDVSYTTLVLAVIGIIVLFAVRKMEWQGVFNQTFLGYVVVVMMLSVPVGATLGFANRVFKYFEVYYIFVLPQGLRLVRQNPFNQMLGRIVFYITCLAWWIITYVYMGFDAIVPYRFFWQ